MKFLKDIKELYDISILKLTPLKDEIVVALKETWYSIADTYVIVTNSIVTGSINALLMVAITAGSVFMISTTISDNGVKVAYAKIQVDHIKLLTEKEKTDRLIDIEMVKAGIEVDTAKVESDIAKTKADAQRDIMEYQARIEEARAATNPYMVSNHESVQPVNVFINSDNSKYVIHTSDGATEIEVSTIKVKGRKYSSEQRKLMTIAYYVGKEVGYPETVQSILLQETMAGAFGERIGDVNLPIGKRSYGVMQMKVNTAKKVLKKHKELVLKYFPARKKLKRIRDEELIIKLIQDDEFNIRLAALNFEIHRKKSRNWSQAVVAYNTGQGGSNKIRYHKKHKYYKHILKRLIKEVRPFNRKANLTI